MKQKFYIFENSDFVRTRIDLEQIVAYEPDEDFRNYCNIHLISGHTIRVKITIEKLDEIIKDMINYIEQ